MKIKQKNLRVFHTLISDEKSFLEFFDKNFILLKEFFLLIEGEVTDNIVAKLQKSGICFCDIRDCDIKLRATKESRALDTQNSATNEPKEDKKEVSFKKIEIFNRPIRSGEEVQVVYRRVVFWQNLIAVQRLFWVEGLGFNNSYGYN